MSIRRSLAYSFAQRYAAFCISFVATMALARLLTPSEIGVYSVGAAFVGLAQILRDFGVGRYIVQERALTDEHVRSTLGIGLILGTSIAALLYIASVPVAAFYRAPELQNVLLVLALSFLAVPFTTPAMALLERELAFKLIFRVNLLNALTHAGTGVALAAAGYGPLSLAWASFGGVVISFVALLVLRPKAVLRKPSLKHWRRILSFGGQASLASFIGHLGSQAPDLIIGRLLGFHAVGLYSRAQGLVLAFEQQFTRSVTTVAFPAYARAHREGHSLKLNYLRGLCYVTVFAWPFFAVLFLVAEPLILLLFGDQWRASAPVARALCVAGAVTAAWSLSPHLMLGAGRVGMFVRLLAATESCRITLIFMAAVSGQSLEVIAWVQAPISLLSFAITTHILGTISEIGFLEILRGMRASALVSLAVLLSSGAAKIGVDGSSELVVVAAVGSAGAITWLIVTFAFRHPITSEIGRVTGSIRSQLFARIFQPVRKG